MSRELGSNKFQNQSVKFEAKKLLKMAVVKASGRLRSSNVVMDAYRNSPDSFKEIFRVLRKLFIERINKLAPDEFVLSIHAPDEALAFWSNALEIPQKTKLK